MSVGETGTEWGTGVERDTVFIPASGAKEFGKASRVSVA